MKILTTFLLFLLACPQVIAQGRNVDSVLTHKSSNLDSIFQRYLRSTAEALKPKMDKKPEIKVEKDSLPERFKSYLKNQLSGQVSAGYHYGLLVGFIDSSSTRPISMFRTVGDLNLDVLGLPISLGYHYSTFKNPLGVNNYVRATVDVEKLRETAKAKKDGSLQSLKGEMTDLEKYKSGLKGKMGYGEVLQQRIKLEIENRKKDLEKEALARAQKAMEQKDSLAQAAMAKGSDTLNLEQRQQQKDSLQAVYEQKKSEVEKYQKMYDSLQQMQQKIQDLYSTYHEKYTLLKEKKEQLESSTQPNAEGLKAKALQHVKQLDLGLCYPQTTGLTNNSIPIKGINIETQKGNWYTAFSAGVTLNNLMISNNVIQNQLQNTQNLFNQFDFQQIRSKRFMSMLVTGLGTKEGTHAFINTRYSNKAVLAFEPSDSTAEVPGSASIELDLRYQPKKFPSVHLDVIYGKTSVSTLLQDSTYSPVLRSLFSSSRSNTGLVRFEQEIGKLNSSYSLSCRWIDPEADMASMGVLQADHIRYELQTKHRFFSWLDLGLNVRKDQNNVARTLDSTMHLLNLGGNMVLSPVEGLQVIGNVQHIQQLNEKNNLRQVNNSNYMFSGAANYQFEVKKVPSVVSLVYSSYKLTTILGDGNYENVAFNHMLRLPKGQNTFSVSSFKALQNDSTSSALILGNEMSLQFQKVQLTLGLKYAISPTLSNDLGGKFELNYKINKHFQYQLRVEKYVLGDFFLNFDPLRFSNFPYALMTQINYTL